MAYENNTAYDWDMITITTNGRKKMKLWWPMAHKTMHGNGQGMAKNNKTKRCSAHGREMAKNEMMKGLLWIATEDYKKRLNGWTIAQQNDAWWHEMKDDSSRCAVGTRKSGPLKFNGEMPNGSQDDMVDEPRTDDWKKDVNVPKTNWWRMWMHPRLIYEDFYAVEDEITDSRGCERSGEDAINDQMGVMTMNGSAQRKIWEKMGLITQRNGFISQMTLSEETTMSKETTLCEEWLTSHVTLGIQRGLANPMWQEDIVPRRT